MQKLTAYRFLWNFRTQPFKRRIQPLHYQRNRDAKMLLPVIFVYMAWSMGYFKRWSRVGFMVLILY